MIYGVIDIGSNTIKAFAYDSGNNLSVTGNMHKPSKLINYIHDGIMSEEGIRTAVSDISELKEYLNGCHCKKIFAFATSATRDCKNSAEIISSIEKETFLQIDILSGKAEALCDAKAAMIPGEEHYLCVDLGGGSAQICEFRNNELIIAQSRPIGALRMKKLFGGGDFPDEKTAGMLSGFICEQISDIKPSEKNLSAVVMGGASQSSKKIKRELDIPDEYDRPDVFGKLFDRLACLPAEQRTALLMEKVPLRAEILGHAMIILDTIMKHCFVKNIHFTEKGSREGYLLYKLEGFDFSEIG